MKNKTKIIGLILVIVVIVLGWTLMKGSTQQVSTLDNIDTVEGFYTEWLKTVQSTATDPYQEGLAKSPILSKTLRDRLVSSQKNQAIELDPVLCQTVAPEEISTRSVNLAEDGAQVLVTSKDKKVTEQALFTLIKHNDGWYIDDITCSPGEFAPDREFSFENEGFLLKDSIPTPFNPKDWHLVFEDSGELGRVAPLFFNSESQCVSLDGDKSVCSSDQFTETTKVSVHGQMTERGVSVNRLEFVK